MRIHESIVVSTPAGMAWRFLRDPDHYPEFMSGITRWEVEGETRKSIR
jgi:carbon monoxide dehydrogenase subunit G